MTCVFAFSIKLQKNCSIKCQFVMKHQMSVCNDMIFEFAYISGGFRGGGGGGAKTARVHQMIIQQWNAATTTGHSYTLTYQFLTDLQTFD